MEFLPMLHRLHRLNAMALALFLALHLANHAALIAGQAAHGAVMQALRPLYRNALVEPALITLFATQIGLGLALAWRRGRPAGGWALAQVASGAVLALFLVQHVPAVLLARPEIETGTAFAAAVVRNWPEALYFIPYYIAAVTALATHLAAARRFARHPAPPGTLARALPPVGLVLGALIVAGLLGAFG
jgi:succinate dehydrogenase/fumarate reductase cytochrome b subunit